MKTYLLQDSDWPWLCGDGDAMIVEAETPELAALEACRIANAKHQMDGVHFKICEVSCDFFIGAEKNSQGVFEIDMELIEARGEKP